jgi:hypothetical protein
MILISKHPIKRMMMTLSNQEVVNEQLANALSHVQIYDQQENDPITCPLFLHARKFAQRGYNTLIKNLNNKSINSYFNIDCLDITLIQSDILNYKLTIEYKDTYPDLIKLNIPHDTIKHIQSYIEKRIKFTVNIFYRRDTPFKAPLWTLTNIYTVNFNRNGINKIIQRHNNEYTHDWSPSIILEKDILYFTERLLWTLHNST